MKFLQLALDEVAPDLDQPRKIFDRVQMKDLEVAISRWGQLQPIWVRDELTPTYLDALAIGMPGDTLDTGRYVLSLEGTTDADLGEKKYEQIKDIPFETAAEE